MRQELGNASYDSISDFLQSLEKCTNPKNASVVEEFAGDSERHGAHWFGADCNTGKDVQKKTREGWPEGRERINELRSKLGTVELVPQDRRRRMTRSDAGDVLDIHQVYAGRLDVAWSVAKRRMTYAPQKIEICANMICSGGEHSDVLFWRGVAATVLGEMLQAAGYMVRLVVCFGGEIGDSDEKVSCRITVKEHGMPFDITSISATILPGFFRALGHGWAAAHAKKRISSPSMSVRQGAVEPGEILITHNVRDHGTALAFVNNAIAKLNAGLAA